MDAEAKKWRPRFFNWQGRGELVELVEYVVVVFLVEILFVVLLVAALGLVVFTDVAWAEDSASGSANISMSMTDTNTNGVKDYSWQRLQSYRLALTKEVTDTINVAGELGVNVTENDIETTTRVAPNVRLNVVNDMFDASAGYRRTERNMDIPLVQANGKAYTATSWNVNLATKLKEYPKVRLNYGEDTNVDHLDVRLTDTKSTTLTGNVDHKIGIAKVYYTYRRSTSDDLVTSLSQVTESHSGKANFSTPIIDGVLSTSGSMSYGDSITKTKAKGDTVSVDSVLSPAHGLYAASTPAPGNPLTIKDSLIDGNKATSTSTNVGGANTDVNIGISFVYATEVEKIWIYTADVSFLATSFSWDVYSSDDNVTWTLVATDAAFSYDTEENRFEIAFSKTKAQYFKVVDTSNDPLVDPVHVTEIGAYAVTTYQADSKTSVETITQNGQFGLNYTPLSWLSLRYDFSENQMETRPSAEFNQNISHNLVGRVERDLTSYLQSALQVQRRLDFHTDSKDTATDTFQLQFTSSPLDTLQTGLFFNHVMATQASKPQSTSSSGLLQIAAELLPSAVLEMDVSSTRYENILGKSTTDTQAVETNLRLEATKTVTVELGETVDWTTSDTTDGASTEQTALSKAVVYWRPVREIYLKGLYQVDFAEQGGDENTLMQYNLNWLPTKKIQVVMSFSENSDGGVQHTFSCDAHYNMSKMISMSLGCDWNQRRGSGLYEGRTITAEISMKF
ncbi:MAG: hypothetical protein AB7E47_00655 [Desulfovibrionaceae bacterium]